MKQPITRDRHSGFTLVELLIVIVIIAILAAITIVAYNGVTNRAHTSAAKQAAQNVVNKAELYNAELGSYPDGTGPLMHSDPSKSYHISSPEGFYDTPEPLTPSSGAPERDNSVDYAACSSGGTITGGRATYWDYIKGTTDSITAGSC